MGCSARWIHDENKKHENDPTYKDRKQLNSLIFSIKHLKDDLKKRKAEREMLCQKLYDCSWEEFKEKNIKLNL